MKLRCGKTGIAIQSAPCSFEMRYDEIDNSWNSNSWKFRCRHAPSDMPPNVWISSIPSGWTRPSSNGAMRSLVDDMKLSRSFGLLTMASPPQGGDGMAQVCASCPQRSTEG